MGPRGPHGAPMGPLGPPWAPWGPWAPSGMGVGPQPLSQAQGCHLRSQQQQQRLQQQQCWQQRQQQRQQRQQQLGLCRLCKYQLRCGFAAAHPILLTQPAKSELLPTLLLLPLPLPLLLKPLLLPTLLLLKPLRDLNPKRPPEPLKITP